MGPAIYVLAILGCGEADTACQQVSVADTVYQSEAACNDATAEAVERNADLLFPVVVAQCRRADAPVSQTVFPEEVALPEADTLPAQRDEGLAKLRLASR